MLESFGRPSKTRLTFLYEKRYSHSFHDRECDRVDLRPVRLTAIEGIFAEWGDSGRYCGGELWLLSHTIDFRDRIVLCLTGKASRML